MKKLFCVLAMLIMASASGLSQITTSHAASTTSTEKKTETVPFDSTRNWLGNKNVNSYIGQILYVKGKSEKLRGYGYRNFKTAKEPGPISGRWGNPATSSSFNTKYDDLVDKYFKVIDVQPDSKQKDLTGLYENAWWFKLQNRDNPEEELWFEYDGQYEHEFPFITVSYFNYLKTHIGTKYVSSYTINEDGALVSRVWENDFKTGEPIKQSKNDRWESIDITIEDEYYNLVLVVKNQNGAVSLISIDQLQDLDGERFVFTQTEFTNLVNKYGAGNMDLVRQHKIRVGMPKALVIMSWGEPNSINRSSHGPDQWVYDSQYVYISNGVVSAWN